MPKTIIKKDKTMSKIITLTLNPTLDKSILVSSLIENQKLKCTEVKLEPGGGAINISRAIKRLGGASTALFLVGGHFGALFTDLFEKKNIDYKALKIKNETRESLIIFDELSSKQYLLNMEGPLVFKPEWQNILTAVSKLKKVDFLVASGSLPKGIPTNFYAKLAKISKKIGAKFILDTSGSPLRFAINEGLYLIKPNLKEMGILSGNETFDIEIAKEKAMEIIKSKKCEVIVISLGADGALLITENYSAHFRAPKVEVKSTVGAGDSMLAGIIYKLSENTSLKDAVLYGVASGAAATLNQGTSLCNKKDADALYNKNVQDVEKS
jgi:6-phosphofructokinase 2